MASYELYKDICRLNQRITNLQNSICCFTNGICNSIDSCLGISPSGNSDLFLNQQGDWTSSGGGGSGWLLIGNSGTTAGINFIGTTDAQDLVFKVNSNNGGRIGRNVPGNSNTAFGYLALDVNAASTNTAFGTSALIATTSGVSNTAIGVLAGSTNTTGTLNTLLGASADVATNSTSNCIALGTGAIASSAELAINPNTKTVNFNNAGLALSIVAAIYGTTVVADRTNYHITFGSGSGAATVDISSSTFVTGSILIISDSNRTSSSNNITIDSGAGANIVSISAIAQTYVLATNGGSVMLQKFINGIVTTWKVI